MLSVVRSAVAVRWNDLQDRLWFIPTLMTVGAVVLALVMGQIDRHVVGQSRSESDWLFGAGVAGAREVLSAIASTMITVTGLVFSITVVALQLASSQFTPRVLRSFTGDRGNQLVLGIFIATFTYALLVLRTVRSSADRPGAVAFVPSASVTVAIILTGCSVGFLIYYISHAADSMRASVIIDRATHDTLGVVRRQYPSNDSSSPEVAGMHAATPATHEMVEIRTTRSGFLQQFNDEHLLGAVQEENVSVALLVVTGQFLYQGAVVARAWPTARIDPAELTQRVERALMLGSERTLRADVELGIRQLADIAVKALSPGINDPTTATICIDRLGQILVEIANRPDQPAVRHGDGGRGTLIRPTLAWNTAVRSAFEEIRHYGSGDPMVSHHLEQALDRLMAVVPDQRVGALDDLHQRVLASRSSPPS